MRMSDLCWNTWITKKLMSAETQSSKRKYRAIFTFPHRCNKNEICQHRAVRLYELLWQILVHCTLAPPQYKVSTKNTACVCEKHSSVLRLNYKQNLFSVKSSAKSSAEIWTFLPPSSSTINIHRPRNIDLSNTWQGSSTSVSGLPESDGEHIWTSQCCKRAGSLCLLST